MQLSKIKQLNRKIKEAKFINQNKPTMNDKSELNNLKQFLVWIQYIASYYHFKSRRLTLLISWITNSWIILSDIFIQFEHIHDCIIIIFNFDWFLIFDNCTIFVYIIYCIPSVYTTYCVLDSILLNSIIYIRQLFNIIEIFLRFKFRR